MSKISHSGNLELLYALDDLNKSNMIIKQGNNIQFDFDDNTNTISLVDTPNVNDLLINNKSINDSLNNKYEKVENLTFEPNTINLNLGTINGLQVPKQSHQAVNKKYVDESIDYFWEQIMNMKFLNFKGMYNPRYTYGMGDLVVQNGGDNYYFYMSLIDMNNKPLDDTNGWVKVSTPVPNNIVTSEQFNKLELKVDDNNNDLLNRYKHLEQQLNYLEQKIDLINNEYYAYLKLTSSKKTLTLTLDKLIINGVKYENDLPNDIGLAWYINHTSGFTDTPSSFNTYDYNELKFKQSVNINLAYDYKSGINNLIITINLNHINKGEFYNTFNFTILPNNGKSPHYKEVEIIKQLNKRYI